MTISTRVIKVILSRNDLAYVDMSGGLRLQVIPDIRDLPSCQKHQSAAFIARQQILVVWEDDPKKLLERATLIQDTLMKVLWGPEPGDTEGGDEKKEAHVEVAPMDGDDLEGVAEKPRRIVLIQPFLTALTMCLVVAAVGGGWRAIAIELVVDGNYIRIAFLLAIIPQIWLALVSVPSCRASVHTNCSSSSSKPSWVTLLS
jgi:hypothetical protein